MDQAERQTLVGGYGTGLSRAFEIAATPAVIAGLGFLIDRASGLFPWCTIAFFTLGVIGMFLRSWFAYDAEMADEERRLFGTPSAGPGGSEARS